MTISLKHTFTSPKADGTDSTLVQPSNWNAEHTITLAAGKVLGRDSSGAGAMQELPISVDSTGQSMIPPSGTTAQRPGTATAGMLRYNTTLGKIELYNGSAWGSVGGGGATVSDTAPSSPAAGDLWWKSDEGQMYVYYNDGSSSQWVIANAFTNATMYLPLTGGTLTGALVGTTGTFSGALATSAALSGATVADTAGNLRQIQQNAQTTGYTLVASDNGKHVAITTGGVTVPSGVFSVGDTVSIYNNSASNQTITQGASVTIYIAGTATTGSRTLAQRGLVTLLCVAANTFVINGGGLS